MRRGWNAACIRPAVATSPVASFSLPRTTTLSWVPDFANALSTYLEGGEGCAGPRQAVLSFATSAGLTSSSGSDKTACHLSASASPHGNVLLQAGAEGAAGHLADALAIGAEDLTVQGRLRERSVLEQVGAGPEEPSKMQHLASIGRGSEEEARAGGAGGTVARLPQQQRSETRQCADLCCRAGAPLLTRPTRRTDTPSASCFLITSPPANAAETVSRARRGSATPPLGPAQPPKEAAAAELETAAEGDGSGRAGGGSGGSQGRRESSSQRSVRASSSRTKEVPGVAPPLANSPGEPRLHGRDILVEIIAWRGFGAV